jgi:uncharacterized protein YndB with AHSA1/START domain
MLMSKAQFMYVTYIAATPERVFAALTEPEFTRQYWDAENVSDWKPGSRWEHWRTDGPRKLAMVGKIVESAPPRRLVFTWATPSDEANPAKHSRVTYEIEAVGDMARLTVTHDELEPGSEMLRGISDGWPRVLSSLKSFIETGRALRTWAGR